MNTEQLRKLLADIRNVRIAVIGDFCLDVYWVIDPAASEPSLETGKSTIPVRGQCCALGGAGNVVNNLVAIGCGKVSALGVIGNDPWGTQMLQLLRAANVDAAGLLVQVDQWQTSTYIKPYVDGDEQSRLDFGNFNELDNDSADRLLDVLADKLPQLDLVVVNEQVRRGIHSHHFRRRLAQLIADTPDTPFIVDSRHFSDAYPGASLKVNDHEAAARIGVERPADALILRQEVLAAVETLHRENGAPVFVTRGARGLAVRDAGGLTEIPGIQVIGRLDTVGAGDSTLAGIAAAMATGATPAVAAELGNFAAAVTIRKLQQTGTAAPEEILAVGSEADYVYRPELADDPRRARFLDDTEFEIVTEVPEGLHVSHVILDHDGTISTLREGWEQIMQPMMIRAVLGDQYDHADEALYRQVVDQVRRFIDQTTGIQTLQQMQGLVRLVEEFGHVPADQVLDAAGYKDIYNKDLLKMVRGRVEKLERGELGVADFVLKNAPELLHALRDHDAVLYLASGTDEADVRREAEALGYADCFNGGIFGAVGDVTREAKREVLDRIIRRIGADETIVTFGDGPVEMRETRKRDGFAVGIASDEVRRYGMNAAKRARLIRAGADLVIPDYSQLPQLLALLGIGQ